MPYNSLYGEKKMKQTYNNTIGSKLADYFSIFCGRQGAKVLINFIFFGILVVLFFYCSVQGIGISSDSIGFLSDGSGFAPLYNYILLFVSDGIVDGAEKAKYLNFIFYFASSLLLYIIVRHHSSSNLIAIFATSAFALNKYVLDLYLLVHSEALGLFLIILFFYLITKHLQKPQKTILLIVSIVAGLIPPSRYAFSFVVVTGFFFFLFHPSFNKLKRITNTAQFCIISVSTTLVTLLLTNRISLSNNVVAGREFAFNGNADLDRYLQGISSFGYMFFPTTLGMTLATVVAIIIVILIIIIFYKSYSTNTKKININRRFFGNIILINCLLYVLLLIISVQIEANLPLYARYMVPFVMFLSLAAGVSFNWPELLDSIGAKKVVVLALVIILLYFPANFLRTAKYVMHVHRNGKDFSSLEWKESKIVKAAKTLEYEENAIILSNSSTIMNFLVGISSKDIPHKFNRRTGKDLTEPYEQRVKKKRELLLSKGGYYVHFDKIHHYKFYLPTKEEIQKEYPFYPFIETADGTIFKVNAMKKE
jgi:hypothetical protein